MKIPMCEHILHIHCLKKWLIDFQKCPVCESNIIRLPQDQQQHNSVKGGIHQEIQLHSPPGLADFEDANVGRNPMLEEIVSPKSHQAK